MDSDADNTHTRGKNWSYNDIINLLYAAINLNVTNSSTLNLKHYHNQNNNFLQSTGYRKTKQSIIIQKQIIQEASRRDTR